MTDDFRRQALDYHRASPPGKIAVTPTKPLATQRDLALAYSPGVAAACEAIVADPAQAAALTARANLVAVITNGTAVLGLGAIGPLAAKPVMEGKAVLFKKFAGIDVFDLEIDETDPDRLVAIIAALGPTFGGINLEDIKAPECFAVESQLRQRLDIPVFHDDQHGTAIIVGAAIRNGLRLVEKDIGAVKIVCSGAGAAALACLDLLVDLGARVENIWVGDILGLVYAGRNELMDPRKERYAQATDARTLAAIIDGADVFLGLSAPRVLTPEMVARMGPRPLVMALANPTPEIMPEEVRAVRPDAIIATGRSDYPNQVNNVLCFPYIFRGALDVGATTINEAMKIACVEAIADLALAEPNELVAKAYGDEALVFGPEFLIPKPFDPRLIIEIAPAVAKAAMASGVATRPIADFAAYRQTLIEFVFRSGLLMKPMFERARKDKQRIIYAEGENERVLRAVQVVIDEGLAQPILIGRPDVIEIRAKRLGLRFSGSDQIAIINPESDPRYNDYWTLYHRLTRRRGVTPDNARTIVRTNNTVIAALALRRGDADAMICGLEGRYSRQLRYVLEVLGLARGVRSASAMHILIHSSGTYFICDTEVQLDPTAQDLADMTLLAAAMVRRFGVAPKIALLSHSNFGSSDAPSAVKMRAAFNLLLEHAPELELDGEMQGEVALSDEVRQRIFPDSRLSGAANLLIMPSLDAANIALDLLKTVAGGQSVGPLLLGLDYPAHIVTPSVTARGIVNISAVAAVDAQMRGTDGTWHAAAHQPRLWEGA